MKFHHVGIACEEIDAVVGQFKLLHPDAEDASDTVFDEEQNAFLKLVRLQDGTRFEFISGPMVSGLVKRRIELYHTCFETADFDNQIKAFLGHKALPLSKPKPAILFGGKRVIFFKTLYGIVELLES
ncbi:VOC family protein [Roseibium sp. SCPC15]|uniref:VOC family protein n=1 Tax=Roseibium sp. SCP15 TaxID=3141376 RepID=UPI0033355503